MAEGEGMWRQAARSSSFRHLQLFLLLILHNLTYHTLTNMSSQENPSPYAARPPPASFDDFMAQVDAATTAHGGIMVDEELYEELFAAAPPG